MDEGEGATVNVALDRPLRLVPKVRHYDWGSRDFIPRLCGREPGDLPEAELWFGAHPDAPADVVLGSDPVETRESRPHDPIPLNRLIANDGDLILGPGKAGAPLPFLTKILSADRPLSIQAHPSREQAVRGFAAENSSAGAETHRTYRDPNHKPELLYALTPFSALSGFRPAHEAARLLAVLGLRQLEPNLQLLASNGDGAYRPLLETLHRHTGTDFAASALKASHAASTTEDPNCREAIRWVLRIAVHHPDDPLILAPLFLRLIRLDPGTALFTGPGVPHSYLEGSAVEVMANSDNVLRLGLTSKRVEAGELLRILDYGAANPTLMEPRIDQRSWGTRSRFQPPVDDFQLDVLHIVDQAEAPLNPDDCARIALVLEGRLAVRNTAGTELLRPGQAALLPAAARSLTATGPGTLALTTATD